MLQKDFISLKPSQLKTQLNHQICLNSFSFIIVTAS